MAHGGEIGPRAEAAALNVNAAYVTAGCALLTHMRKDELYDYGTCALLRPSLELAGRSIFISQGTSEEVTRFKNGPRLRASEYWPRANAAVELRRPGTWEPKRVYDWLCRFTHFEESVMREGPSRESAYAALAYVSWVCAIAAELVTGLTELAKWPESWPAQLPW
jgi:hypothetical protein